MAERTQDLFVVIQRVGEYRKKLHAQNRSPS